MGRNLAIFLELVSGHWESVIYGVFTEYGGSRRFEDAI